MWSLKLAAQVLPSRPYDHLLHDYSPFVGPPDVQQYFDDGLSDVEQRREEAERHRFMHREYLQWESLKESLKANGFADDELLLRLDVHFRFLSAFVHPNTDVLRLVYGRNSSWPSYDHYSSEAVLLYITVLAVEELRSFVQMAQRPPAVEIDGEDKIVRLCDRAWDLSSYFWYPGQRPHDHDRLRRPTVAASGFGALATRRLKLRSRCQTTTLATMPSHCGG